MGKNETIILGISIGDLNGIGPEVVLKAFEDPRMLDFCTPVIFASDKLINWYVKHFQTTTPMSSIDHLDAILPNKINVLNCWKEPFEVRFGTADKNAGRLAITSLKEATKALKNNQINVLVTAPIDKKNSQSEVFNFPGHTDFLAQELGGKSLMFMISEFLRVGLLTDHVPVKDAPNQITPELIESKLRLMETSLIQDFGIIKPKIAVLGINPHSGDQGIIGNEDQVVVGPTLERLRERGLWAFGPYAADGFFGSGQYKDFDAVLAAYHDQGLIPFKTLSFGTGVNFTAGLSHVRTSPDHGTAFAIAGQNTADPTSFKEAVFAAIGIYKKRASYVLHTKNPLKVSKQKSSSKKNF